MALKYREGREGKQQLPSRAKLSHLRSRVLNVPLMIHPAKLQVILQELGTRFVDQDHLAATLSAIEAPATLQTLGQINLRSGTDRKSYAVTETGIALIPVEGALLKKSSWMSSWSGTCTYEDIAAQFSDAINDPTIKAVMFDIDSPGGETHGAFELSDLIYKARGTKPIYAAANDLAASAAYAIASAADKVYLTITGAVGSIGVYCLHADQQGLDDKMGVTYTYIYAGERKVDGNPHEPLSKTAKGEAQSEIDRQYGIFVSTVARNRDLSSADVVGTKALCYFASNAVPMLADEVGTLEDAVAALEKSLKISGVSSVQRLASAENVPAISTTSPTISPISTPNISLDPAAVAAPIQSIQGELPMSKEALAAQIKEHEDKLKALKLQAAAVNGTDPAAPPADPNPTSAADPCDEPDEDDDTKMAKIAATAALAAVRSNRAAATSTRKVAATAAAPAPAPAAPAAPAVDPSADAFAIAELCTIAGMPHLTSQFLLEKKDAAQVRAELATMRSAASNTNPTNSYHNSGRTAGEALDQFEQSANAMMAQSGGKMTKAQAYEQVLMTNPQLYERYEDERAHAFTNSATKRAYSSTLRQKFSTMGLGMGAH